MALSSKQKDELNNSILGYLQKGGFQETYNVFIKELESNSFTVSQEDTKFQDLLEKKWTSVLRLQKKVMELESKLKQWEEETKGKRKGGGTGGGGVPVQPERFNLVGHRKPILCVAFNPLENFKQIATGSEDATIKLWDYESGEYEKTFKGHTNHIQDVKFHFDGKILASCSSDLTIKVWNLERSECIKTLFGHDHNVCSISFIQKDNYQLLSCSRDTTVKFWDVNTGYCLRTLQAHDDWIRKVTTSPDSTLFATCSNDKSVRIWELSTWKCLHVLRDHTHVVESIAFSNPTKELNNVLLASGSRDKTIRVWDVSTGTLLATLVGHDNWVRGLVFSKTNQRIISCSDDKTIRVWELTKKNNNDSELSYQCLKVIHDAHTHFINCLDYNFNDGTLTTGSVDNSLKVWECS